MCGQGIGAYAVIAAAVAAPLGHQAGERRRRGAETVPGIDGRAAGLRRPGLGWPTVVAQSRQIGIDVEQIAIRRAEAAAAGGVPDEVVIAERNRAGHVGACGRGGVPGEDTVDDIGGHVRLNEETTPLRRASRGAVAGNSGIGDGERASCREDSAPLPRASRGTLGRVARDRVVVELERATAEKDRSPLSVRASGRVVVESRVGEADGAAGDVEGSAASGGAGGRELRGVAAERELVQSDRSPGIAHQNASSVARCVRGRGRRPCLW